MSNGAHVEIAIRSCVRTRSPPPNTHRASLGMKSTSAKLIVRVAADASEGEGRIRGANRRNGKKKENTAVTYGTEPSSIVREESPVIACVLSSSASLTGRRFQRLRMATGIRIL